MGRSIFAELQVESLIQSYFRDVWAVGIVIGQLTQQRDYVIHLVKTPAECTQETTGDDSLLTVTEHWVVTHAKQVVRMLPGGLQIIGLFAIGPPDLMKKTQAKLRQMLYAVEKSLRDVTHPTMKTVTDRVLLQICSTSHKLTCSTIDVADMRSTFQPADWRYQSFVDQWAKVQTTLTVDWTISVSSLSVPLNKQIQAGLTDYLTNVCNSLATVNGKLMSDESMLNVHQEGSSSKKKKHTSKMMALPAQPFNVELFAQTSPVEVLPVPCVDECGAQMTFEGSITGCAFLHSKATVREAVQAVKDDVVRSLISRCNLLCEDLLQTEEEQDINVVYETPVRVMATLDGSPLTFCDYMFQDEAAMDAAERFRELFNLDVKPDNITMNLERIPSADDLREAEHRAHESFHVGVSSMASEQKNTMFTTGVVTGILTAMAGVLVGFYMMMTNTQDEVTNEETAL